MVTARGFGEEEIRSCLMDTEIQFSKMKGFWRLITQQCEYN